MGGEGGGTGLGGIVMSVAGLLPEPYWLKGRSPAGMFDPITNRATANQIDDYRALAVVSRLPRSRLQTKLFKDRSPAAYAIAESWVHNYTSFDLYTQDWMASLAPTSLADDIGAVSSTIKNSPASDSYSALTQVFDQGGANGWSDVNNH
ncbi:hypothetical protein LZK73_33770 (plasmid) [Neorhizobium galegae]|nr:hypothetical protein LZK73_33770 [Neorhizobium galegae]